MKVGAYIHKRNFSFNYPCPRRLREIVKQSLFEKETPENIKNIWFEYHNAKPHTVSKTLVTPLYLQLLTNAQNSPMFITPVPKTKGHFMLVSQNQQKSFIFTYLEDFKKNPLSANPYFVVTCFDELARTKGITLLRGDVIGGISKEEGQTVLNILLNNYLVDSSFQNVKTFNHEPNKFNIDQFTQEGINQFRQELEIVKTTTPPPKDIGAQQKQDWKF